MSVCGVRMWLSRQVREAAERRDHNEGTEASEPVEADEASHEWIADKRVSCLFNDGSVFKMCSSSLTLSFKSELAVSIICAFS
jgi:hypothetical protein